MKKFASILLAAVLVLALCIPAFAYDINITSDVTGHTYEAYQIFSGTYAEVNGNATLGDIDWGTGINGDAFLAALKADTTFDTTFDACTTAAEVAAIMTGANWGNDSANAKLFAKLAGDNLTAVKATSTATTGGYNITNLTDGYYLVQDVNVPEGTDSYTSYILQVIKDQTVTPKVGLPTVTKKVEENTKYNQDGGFGTGFNDVADYNINDVVDFKLIGTLPANYADYDTYSYTFHDTQSAGLTFDDTSVVVTAGGTILDAADYAVTVNPDDGHTFDIVIDNLKDIAGLTAASQIVVTYSSTLNKDAVIGLDGNPNEVYLEFSNNPNGEGTGTTETDKVIVFTYELDVTKVDGAGTAITTGAHFRLYKTVEGVKNYAIVDADDSKITGWTTVETDASDLVSDNDGTFAVIGLDDGDYFLEETQAPAGYNVLTAPIAFSIGATTVNDQDWNAAEDAGDALTALSIDVGGTVTNGNLEDGTVDMDVVNNTGSTLPSTGGIGTTIFYVVGTMLMLGAAILMITKKRMAATAA